MPGTETNVTPDMLEPIMANATTYHRDRRLPTKKPALSARLPARYDTVKSSAKYAAMRRRTRRGDTF
jgi:hypothetical protein